MIGGNYKNVCFKFKLNPIKFILKKIDEFEIQTARQKGKIYNERK